MASMSKPSLEKVVFPMSLVAIFGVAVASITGWQMYADLATTVYVDTEISAVSFELGEVKTELIEVNKGLNYLTEREARRDVEELQVLVCDNPGDIAYETELTAALSIYADITGMRFPSSELGCN